MKKLLVSLSLSAMFSLPMALADSVTVDVKKVDPAGKGASIGTVTFTDSQYGLLIFPQLKSLPPGVHGFHIHQNPSCKRNGFDAGEHLDPNDTGMHLGPFDSRGHLGDLPVLMVDASGQSVVVPVLAPKLKVADLKKHSLIIHAGGDNYSDKPEKLGGGGARVACAIIR